MAIEVEVLGIKLELETDERLFSPRGLDAGTRAMLELAEVSPRDRVLDLGCGHGVVGLAIAKRYQPELVMMVDIDETAVAVSRKNAELNNLLGPNLCIKQSDGLSNVRDTSFTVILSNPPYHVDFSVPKRFIEDGFTRLEVGGHIYLVVKRRKWYENRLRSVFGNVRVFEKDGYYVMMSRKKEAMRPKPVQTPKASKKHMKREAAAAARKRRRRLH